MAWSKSTQALGDRRVSHSPKKFTDLPEGQSAFLPDQPYRDIPRFGTIPPALDLLHAQSIFVGHLPDHFL